MDLPRPLFVETVLVESAREMFEAVTARSGEQDIIVKAAAVADYRPARWEQKKSRNPTVIYPLPWSGPTTFWDGWGRTGGTDSSSADFPWRPRICWRIPGPKLAKKQIDMIVANNLKVEGAGFGTDTNVVTLITRESETELPIMSKEEVADRLLTEILKRTKGQGGLNPA